MGSTESPGQESVVGVSMTQEERLLQKLSEVERIGAKISAELRGDTPCKGIVHRELLELELGALERDRESIEAKLGRRLLTTSTDAPREGLYRYSRGMSPNYVTPATEPGNPCEGRSPGRQLAARASTNTRGMRNHSVGASSGDRSAEYGRTSSKRSSGVSPPPTFGDQHQWQGEKWQTGNRDSVGDSIVDVYADGSRNTSWSSSSSTVEEMHDQTFRSRYWEHGNRTGHDTPSWQKFDHNPHFHHQHLSREYQTHDASYWTAIAPTGSKNGAPTVTSTTGSLLHSYVGTCEPNEVGEARNARSDFRDHEPCRGYFSCDVSAEISRAPGGVTQRTRGAHEGWQEQRADCNGNGCWGDSREGGARVSGASSTGLSNLLRAASSEDANTNAGYLCAAPLPSLSLPSAETTGGRRHGVHVDVSATSLRGCGGRGRGGSDLEAPSFRVPTFWEGVREEHSSEGKHCFGRRTPRVHEETGWDRRILRHVARASRSIDQGLDGEGGAQEAFGRSTVPVPVALSIDCATNGGEYARNRRAKRPHPRGDGSDEESLHYELDGRGNLGMDKSQYSDRCSVSNGRDDHANVTKAAGTGQGESWCSSSSSSSRGTLSQHFIDDHRRIHRDADNTKTSYTERCWYPEELIREGHEHERKKQCLQGDLRKRFKRPTARVCSVGEVGGGGGGWVRGKNDGHALSAQSPTH